MTRLVSYRHLALPVAAGALSAALIACGGQALTRASAASLGPSGNAPASASTAGPTAATPGPSTAPAAGGTDLTIVGGNGPVGGAATRRLTCDPPGGTVVDPARACATIAARPELLRPIPSNVMCTQQYGGPQTARITGTWRGTKVDLRVTRTDGCQIGRWTALSPLLG